MSTYYIRARSDGRIFETKDEKMEIDEGTAVLFENEQCQEIGKVISKKCAVSDSENNKNPILPTAIIRRVNEKDEAHDIEKQKSARSNIATCREIILRHNLPMELADADLSFDDKKLTFYFTAPGRVDFRSMVSELASSFHKLIRLQQVGARERAKCVGGIGRCGEEYCCKRFMKGNLDGATLDMAAVQNLGQMGPGRVTGSCGKVMCCLRHELEGYVEAKKKMPAIGTQYKTSKGVGKIVSQNILKNSVTVYLGEKGYMEAECTK
ncbi:MAG: regulatory iron-sulfur-containing complex subunit RicT [Candidatus Berkelbacteria bacterium]